jgi:hypothetical protein
MQPSRFQSEKRNFRRMTMDCPVSYQLVNSPNQKMGTCINLSANGILFECDDKYPIGTRININVSPDLAISPSFSAVMEVIRVNSTSNKQGYQLAGTLENIH